MGYLDTLIDLLNFNEVFEKTANGYIIEVDGERHFFTEDMVLTVLAGLLGRAI
ncbi:hypothetical protein BT69DRAFT_1283418 [Atractiella rhizophila]|nr:hypothetical protein BT69DRAFT_1283418 [Atractiella rhizophila]